MTGTTIGYGDFAPTLAAARAFSVFIAFIVVALMTLFTAHVVTFFIGRNEAPAAEISRALATLRDELVQTSSAESMRVLQEVQHDVRVLALEVAHLKRTLETSVALRQAIPGESAAGGDPMSQSSACVDAALSSGSVRNGEPVP